MITFDQATVDSSGAFLIGELERLDQTLNLPLVGYTWTRDIQLREDVSIADDISSWTNTSFAAAGTGANPNGKNWVGKDSTAIAGVNVDIGKSGNPLNLWGMELGWTIIELQAAQQVGRPIDTQKYDGMQLKWQMDNDEQVYVGDSALNLKGLVTLDGVPVNNAAKTWATSTPDEIRASINQVLSDAWAASGYSVVPRDLLIPPEQFALLSSIIVSSAGNQSLLTYLQTNTISYHQNGVPLNIRAVKWLKGRGVGNKDRMVAYTNDKKYVRYPLVPLQSVPVQYRGLYQIVTYYGKLGAVEAGNQSLLTYLAVNTIAFHQNGVPLEIKAVKWLKGRGVGGKDRMIAYTNDKKYVRYPLVPLQSVPIQYRGLYQIATYYGKLGAVEPVYKETISYVDGI